MKYGVREICEVVMKAKYAITLGEASFAAGAPVFMFDSLKTSSLEGKSTSVYAQGGRGNPKLVAWEGDREITFTMEDALISPVSFAMLSGAGMVEASDTQDIFVHSTEQVTAEEAGSLILENEPSNDSKAEVFIMELQNGRIKEGTAPIKATTITPASKKIEAAGITAEKTYIVDYYQKKTSGVQQIEIEAGKFGYNYYLEAATLFRSEQDGKDYPAEFIIPNCRIQSNFTFTMAPTGDPSTFTFTLDAFPDYTKFDSTKKVLAALQIIEDAAE